MCAKIDKPRNLKMKTYLVIYPKTNMSEQLAFYTSSDYRSGISLVCLNETDYDIKAAEDPEYYEQEAMFVYHNLPNAPFEFRINLVENLGSENKIIWYLDTNDNDDENGLSFVKVYQKIFSQVHGSLPFVKTGYTGSYTDTGFYPKVPKEIKKMRPLIDDDLVDKISYDNYGTYYFLFMSDDDGQIHASKMIAPIC